MSAPLLKLVREVIANKLMGADLPIDPALPDLVTDDALMLADEIARNVLQAFMPTLEAYTEACALLDQTLGLVDVRDFRSSEDQAKVRAAREFLGGGIRKVAGLVTLPA